MDVYKGILAAMLLFCSLGSQTSAQQKTQYYIDVLAVVDYALYSRWLAVRGEDDASAVEQEVKQAVAYLFQGVDQRYSTITSLPYTIRVQLSGIIVAKTAADSPWTENVKNTTASTTWVQADNVLEKLEQYVRDDNDTLPQNDHVMLITGYDLIGRDASTSGYAGVKTVCTSNGLSVSVIEYRGPSVTEATAAHELGHSLGAEHDGTNNTCSADDNYIMSPGGDFNNVTLSASLTSWNFSDCSIKYFDQNIQALKTQGLEQTCLLKRLPQEGVPAVPAQLPPDPDEQCRQTYGPESYLCREYVAKPEDLCQMMRCFNPASAVRACSLMPAASESCCGSGQICRLGKCNTLLSGTKCSQVKGVCPFGDQPQPIAQANGEIKCSDISSQHCYEPAIQLKCCSRCQQARINKTGCDFGDRKFGCQSTYCSSTTQTAPEEYDLDCCGTCNATRPIDPNCSDQAGLLQVIVTGPNGQILDSIDGETCQVALVTPEKTGRCCLQQLRDTCCHSCEKRRGTSEDCPFGDCAGSACNVLKNMPVKCDADQKKSCCRTCNEIELALNSASTTTTTTTTTITTTTRTPTGTTSLGAGDGGDQCGEPGQPTCGACLLSANLSFVVALSSLSSCLWLIAASFGR